MSIEAIVARYGLVAIFAGAGIEGEAVVLAGGWLAHRGAFPLWAVMMAAAAGSFLADQAWFFAGRHFHDHRWIVKARAKPAFAKALTWFHRHPGAFIFAFRFVYGFRTVSPIAIGTTDVSARLFVVVNLMSAILWAILFATVGFVFGHGFERFVGRLIPGTGAWIWIAGGLAIAAGIALWLRRRAAA